MTDWTKSYGISFEYYVVDPWTWKDKELLTTVKSCTINRDFNSDTLGSASIAIAESTGEVYIRVYIKTNQNGITEREPLGTFLVQTPVTSFNGKTTNINMDTYTPLIELKENKPPIGYFVPKGSSILETAYNLTRENLRAPVIKPEKTSRDTSVLHNDFIAYTEDTWFDYISQLISNDDHYFALDETGRIMIAPKQKTEELQPIWTFDTGNSSILYPNVSTRHDIFNVPNAVEVLYSNGTDNYYVKIVNDDPNSPLSTVNRGREIIHRVTNPDVIGNPTSQQIDEYAKNLLKELSTIEYTITYSHGYCPVRIGDCVRLNYPEAGLNNVKARVMSQSIHCSTNCQVDETATFYETLWR